MTADMPDAVKVAREACAMRAEEENFPDYAERVRAGEEDTWSEVSGAILGAQAMQAAMAGRELRVKALEWVDRHANPIRPNDLVANSIVGRYAIRPSADGARFRLFIPGHDYNDAPEFNSIEAAKGAGKVHFDQTIRSALEPAGAQEGASFQQRVQPWMLACFGPKISADKLERGDRLLEEVLELLQSVDYPRERIASLSSYVWSRPKGEPAQEVGGSMVTLAAFCLAHDLDMHAAGETELARIWTKVEAIRAKQAAKPTGSALPVVVENTPAPDVPGLVERWWQDFLDKDDRNSPEEYPDMILVSFDEIKDFANELTTDTLATLQAEVATLQWERNIREEDIRRLRGDCRSYAKTMDAIAAADADEQKRLKAAEAERDALKAKVAQARREAREEVAAWHDAKAEIARADAERFRGGSNPYTQRMMIVARHKEAARAIRAFQEKGTCDAG